MKLLRVLPIALVLAGALTIAPANAGVGNDIPSESLGSAHGLNYRSVSYSPFVQGDIDLFAECGETAAVVGGGVDVSGPVVSSQLAYGYPRDGEDDVDEKPDDMWAGGAINFTSNSQEITTYSVCRKSGSTTVRYPTKVTEQVAADASFSAKVACPRGTHVVSGGSDVYRGRVPVSVPYDSGDGGKLPDDGWKIRAVNSEGVPADLTSFAVCLLGPVSDLDYRSRSATVKPDGEPGRLTPSCKTSQAVIGGGVSMSGNPALHFVHASLPSDARTDATAVPDDRWRSEVYNDEDTKSNVRAWAICLN